jgi:hypothetical protein
MGSNTIIVREYLESLKEDTELDYLFPILLTLMGYKVIATAKEAKGQKQYGKDIVAVGKDETGAEYRWYFELKGHKDKDITYDNFFGRDGIDESLREAKYVAFHDSSIPNFNHLPIKIVLVHNGTIKQNIRPTFEGLISSMFKPGEFERWDIFKLTDLFSNFLFSEYLLTDEESIRLFKRVLVLLDAPDNDYSDFKQLLEIQFNKIDKVQGRALRKLLATLNLLSILIVHYSRENNNLYPARECITYLILRTWSWILRNNLENKKAIISEYKNLLRIHYDLLASYFKKTFTVASNENGLFAENGGPFEAIGYPLRSLDYLNYLVYFFQVRQHYPKFPMTPNKKKAMRLRKHQKKALLEIVSNNDGCCRPVVDNHLIPILNVVFFFLQHDDLTKEELLFIGQYLNSILDNLMVIKVTRDRFPELHSNVQLLAEFIANDERPDEYEDRSSLLITVLMELLAVINAESIYSSFKDGFKEKVNLQVAYPVPSTEEMEMLLFEKHMHDEYYVDTNINLPDTLKEFQDTIRTKEIPSRNYRTDKAGLPFLRTLAHIYYHNEFFPEEWRRLIPKG